MTFVLTAFLIFGLVVLTAVVFVAWTCVRVVAWIFAALFGLHRHPQQWTAAQSRATSSASPCARPNCRAANPPHARFCHRCGNALAVGRGMPQPVRMRYVA
jgi:hypothetical protein